MSDSSKDNGNVAWAGVLSALGGLATLLGMFYYIIHSDAVGDRWQTLGMLAVAAGIAIAVAAMLRFSLAPQIASKSSAADVDAMRGRIAPIVLTIGIVAIVVLAVALIIAFVMLAQRPEFEQSLRPKIDTLLTGVFSTVLPVVATWVGTVLAFYFGSENFRQATQSTRDVLGDRLAPKKKISDVMIPYERIARLAAETEEDASKLPMLDVIHTMSEAATRVIVFNTRTQTPIYIIRSSSPPMPENWITADYRVGPGVPDEKITIKNYLDANNAQNKTDATKFRFIDSNATPEAALEVMRREGVDDLFITSDGLKTSRVLGWVAAHDLLKKEGA